MATVMVTATDWAMRASPGACLPSAAKSLSRLLALATALLALALAAQASAHTGGENHRAIVSIEPDAIRTLLLMQVPAGERATALLARFDMDRNGELNALESQLLVAKLGAETVGGWVLKVGKVAPRPKDLAARASVTESGGLLVAILLEYPPASRGERVRVRVLETPAGSPVKARPVFVEVQAPAGVAESSHPVAKDAPVMGPVVLAPGKSGAWLRAKQVAVPK